MLINKTPIRKAAGEIWKKQGQYKIMPDLLSNKCFALCIISKFLFDNLDLTVATFSFQFNLLSIT